MVGDMPTPNRKADTPARPWNLFRRKGGNGTRKGDNGTRMQQPDGGSAVPPRSPERQEQARERHAKQLARSGA